MANRISLAICFFIFIGYSVVSENVFALEPKQVVESCLNAIKNKDYKKSYEYFSLSLKSEVKLEDHVANLKNIENSFGRLVNYSDRLPIFRHYVLDENMFSGLFSKKKQLDFRYLLNFERGCLSLYAEIIKENNEYKLSFFYLEELKKGK